MIEQTGRNCCGRPRYLMGVGTPTTILEAVARVSTCSSCVMPTRNGRHGMASHGSADQFCATLATSTIRGR